MLTNFSQKQTEKLIIVVKLFIYTMQDAEQRDHSPLFLIIKSHHYKWMYTPKHALTHTHTHQKHSPLHSQHQIHVIWNAPSPVNHGQK